MQIGKAIRLERIIDRDTGRAIIVPLDHGVTVGPIDGLIDFKDTVTKMVDGGANAVLMHKGLVPGGHRSRGRDVGLIVHLSASTALSPLPGNKTLVCSVEEAIALGADAVSLHVNLGDPNEANMLSDFGRITAEAGRWGIPVLAMVYGRGPKIKDEYDVEVVAHCARVGVELGADVIKVPYTGDPTTFAKVVAGSRVPVVIAGGPKADTTEGFLTMVKGSLDAGGKGLSVGRNIFQAKDPVKLLAAVKAVVHEGKDVDQALKIVGF